MQNRIIALDADGVLLDYNLGYAAAWKRAFGIYPKEVDPNAYWAQDRWDVEQLDGDRLEHFRASFDETFWESLYALPGAIQACKDLKSAGYLLVCVTALTGRFVAARKRNLQQLGFPIETVIATGKYAEGKSPKAVALNLLSPAVFVDDYLPYMAGVRPGIHRALITRDPNGSPNAGAALQSVASKHNNLREFSDWWLSTATV
ncbi:HAD family hydrolase [Rhodoferax sp. AJA081-3]|uniref:HAD family hydrolase n=1 Tax=Rhodoferax sp. AJA081-3 TaxID=2752316 RepID=UPI001AE00B7C|nr:HAD family hydrolase [Rhodoferax sp. AJA081-3]QTN26226.1 HAD family hydrolase [Rhodoferax sp. AJA081-3]